MPIELWQVRQYGNSAILFNQLKAKDTTESIKTVTKDITVQAVANEIKVYNVSDHFSGSRSQTMPLYEMLRDKLTSLASNVHENPRGKYIGFSLRESGNDTFIYAHIKLTQFALTFLVLDPAMSLIRSTP